MTLWATPQALDEKSGAASQETLDKNSRPLNEQAEMLWGTPRVAEAMCLETLRPVESIEKHKESRGRTSTGNLEDDVVKWNTPAVPNGGRMGARTEEGREGKERHLEHQAASLTGPPAQPTAMSGSASSPRDPTSPRPRLNARFVEWLQGLPEGWVQLAPMNSEVWETWSCRSRALLLS